MWYPTVNVDLCDSCDGTYKCVEFCLNAVLEIQEERKKFPDRYPKKLLHQDGTPINYNIAGKAGRRFALYEGTEQQMINLAACWVPEMTWEFVPIFEAIAKRL